MGLMRNYNFCPDCKRENVCFFIKQFIQESDYEYEVIPQKGLNIHLGDTWLIFSYCPYCGKKIRLWHYNQHWHITEIEVELTKTYVECNFIKKFLDNSGFEYKVGKDKEFMIRMNNQWISLYYCPDCGDKLKME